MAGIKETKEALVGVNELSLVLISRLKDGLQPADVVALLAKLQGDEEFKNKLVAAAQGIKELPAEIKDLQLIEAVDLLMTQLDYLPKIAEAAKAA
jgi:hypothetical protein